MRERTRAQEAELEQSRSTESSVAGEPSADGVSEASAQTQEPAVEAEDDPEASKKRKRQERKLKKREARLAKEAAVQTAEGSAPREAEDEGEAYDPTLLAVIGVLDEVKRQQNVAAWIRAGGLWGPSSVSGEESAQVAEDGTSEEGPFEGTEKTSADAEPQGESVELDEDGRDSGKRKRARHRSNASQSPAGNDRVSASSPDRKDQTRDTTTLSQPMWFEDPATLRYWVQRGKEALEELGIPADHGIER